VSLVKAAFGATLVVQEHHKVKLNIRQPKTPEELVSSLLQAGGGIIDIKQGLMGLERYRLTQTQFMFKRHF
jgi:hypothetical protein